MSNNGDDVICINAQIGLVSMITIMIMFLLSSIF